MNTHKKAYIVLAGIICFVFAIFYRGTTMSYAAVNPVTTTSIKLNGSELNLQACSVYIDTGRYEAKVMLDNAVIPASEPVILIIAIYDGAKLMKIANSQNSVPTSDGLGRTLSAAFAVTIPEVHTNYKIKLFLWYTLDGAGPLESTLATLMDKVLVMPQGPNLIFSDIDRVVFIGDSVTAYGSTPNYLKFIYDYYATRYPQKKMSFTNLGVGGNSLSDAIAYESYEVVPANPNKAVITLGMNDVNRSIWSDANPSATVLSQRQSAVNSYRTNYEKLITDLKAKNIGITLSTPSIYDQTMMPNGSQYGANNGLVLLSGVVGELAQKYNLPVVQYNEPMLSINKYYQGDTPTATIIGSDRVHPGALGHALMGYLFLKQTGATPEVATVEIDRTTSNVLKASNCNITNLIATSNNVSFDYTPNCLPLPVTTEYKDADKLARLTQGLNMELFKITGLPDGNYTLSMDNEFVQQYTSVSLAKGVNLAVEPYNPGQMAALNISQINLQREMEETKLRDIRFAEKTKPIVKSFCTFDTIGEYIPDANYKSTQAYINLSSSDKTIVDNYILLKLNVTTIKANVQANIDAMYDAVRTNVKLHSVKLLPSVEVVNMLVNDNFNYSVTGYTPGGWTASGVPLNGSIGVDETPSSTNKSLKIYQNSSASIVSTARTFDKQSGSGIVIQFKAMAPQTNKWISINIQSSSGTTACQFALGHSGTFRYGSAWTVGPTYSAGTFYDIKIVANTDTDQFDLYIGGLLVGSNVAFNSPQTDIQKITFGTSASLSTAFFDNVQVSRN